MNDGQIKDKLIDDSDNEWQIEDKVDVQSVGAADLKKLSKEYELLSQEHDAISLPLDMSEPRKKQPQEKSSDMSSYVNVAKDGLLKLEEAKEETDSMVILAAEFDDKLISIYDKLDEKQDEFPAASGI